MTKTNVNTTAGGVRKLTSGTSAGKYQATAILGEGRGATKRTKTFAREGDAKRWLADVRTAGLAHGAASDQTLAEAFATYLDSHVLAPKTTDCYQRSLAHVAAAGLGDVRLAKLRASCQRQFVTALVRSGLAPRTVNMYAAKLTAVLRFAAADGALSFTPETIAVDVVDDRDVDAITPRDVAALHDAATDYFAPAILLQSFCGLRMSEAAAVNVGDVDWSAGTVSVTKAIDRQGQFVATKTPRSVRTVPVPANVLDQLQAHRFRPESEPLARNGNGGRLTTAVYVATFADVASDAGVDVTSHALRKFYVTAMLAAGVNPKSVAKWIGDRLDTMLSRYALTRHDDADAGRAAIAAAFDATAAA